MIDFDKFKYRVGDRIRKLEVIVEAPLAEYEILEISERSKWSKSFRSYKLKNLSPGCVNSPSWQSQNVVHRYYEPCNPAIKLLYSNNVTEFRTEYVADYVGGKPDTIVMDPKHLKLLQKVFNSGDKLSLISTPRGSGKSWIYQQYLQDSANRAELAKPDSHSLDALRYSVLGQPSKKVSR